VGNVEIVLDLYARGENVLDLIHEDVEWHMPHPGGDLRGRDELIRWWPQFEATWEEHVIDIQKVWELEDGRVLVFFRESGIGRGSGVRTEASPAALWTLRDGRVVHFQGWGDRAEALREVGLSAPPPGGDPPERGAAR
jgi:ketosteroid isomerase-like protein